MGNEDKHFIVHCIFIQASEKYTVYYAGVFGKQQDQFLLQSTFFSTPQHELECDFQPKKFQIVICYILSVD